MQCAKKQLALLSFFFKGIHIYDYINTYHELFIDNNKKKIITIISSILFCSTQEITQKNYTAWKSQIKEILILQFILELNLVIQSFTKSFRINSKYILARFQNTIINIAGKIFLRKITS